MQAVVLVAGKGIRLYPYTEKTPKCLLKINDRTILERTLVQLRRCGIRQVVLVSGYFAESVEATLSEIQPKIKGLDVSMIVNPLYYKTGTLYSLWLSREKIVEDFLVVEGDVVCDIGIFRRLLEADSPNLLVIDRKTSLGEEEMKVQWGAKGIQRISKEIEEAQAEFIGISRFSKEGGKIFFDAMETWIQQGRVKAFYEEALETALDRLPLDVVETGRARWTEIDYIEEYQKARTIFLDEEPHELTFDTRLFEQTTHSPSISALAGGFEAANVRDFCYLSNPYFPPEEMVNELMLPFVTLMRHYPSEQGRLSELVAAWLGASSEEVAVGNGASELILSLNRLFVRRLFIPIPTYSEYIETLSPEEKEPFYFSLLEEEGFRTEPGRLLEAFRRSGCDALVLINPNNPTGGWIPKKEMMELLDRLQEAETILLDESFIDFASEKEESLLDVRKRYPNLFVVKSMAKEYGVSGLRLGYCASGNREKIQRLRRSLPVWNVNTLCERFLEILPKYRKAYLEARRKVIETTRKLHEALCRLKGIRVFPTRANFVLMKLENGMTGSELQDLLLRRYRMYVRDASNKVGLSNVFVRIASRTQEENVELVDVLSKIFEERSS